MYEPYSILTLVPASMGGECRMVGVACATPTLPSPYQLLSDYHYWPHQQHTKSTVNHALAILTLDTWFTHDDIFACSIINGLVARDNRSMADRY